MEDMVSRRTLLTGLAGTALTFGTRAALAEKQTVPIVSKRVEKVFRAPGKMPNALQFVEDGLWILDEANPNKVHKVRREDGSVIVELQTESITGSGLTYGKGFLWINSSGALKTLKVDPATGKTLQQFVTPGAGPLKWAPQRVSGGAGMKWIDDKYWMVSMPTMKIDLMEPDTCKVIRSIPAPGQRPHDLALDKGTLWCSETDDRAIYQINPKDGRLLAKIQLTKEDPAPHGLEISEGVMWYSDASSGWICRLV